MAGFASLQSITLQSFYVSLENASGIHNVFMHQPCNLKNLVLDLPQSLTQDRWAPLRLRDIILIVCCGNVIFCDAMDALNQNDNGFIPATLESVTLDTVTPTGVTMQEISHSISALLPRLTSICYKILEGFRTLHYKVCPLIGLQSQAIQTIQS